MADADLEPTATVDTAPSPPPAADAAPRAKPKKPPVVAEDEEKTVATRFALYTFRPGQVLDDPFVADLARANNIALK